MKKMLLFLFICVFVTNSFANDIAANVTNPVCDNATLEKYSGTVNVEINWEPNTIDLSWYDGDTLLNVPTEAQSCVYDGDMYIPTQPTKTGYTFMGWTVHPEYDFSTIPIAPGIHAWSKNAPGTSCWYGDGTTSPVSCDNGDFDDLDYYEFKTSFNFGVIYGVGLCSSTEGTEQFESGTPNETISGQYCWCKVNIFKEQNTGIKYIPSKSLPWGYGLNLNSENQCKAGCADWCSAYLVYATKLKQNLFGITQ